MCCDTDNKEMQTNDTMAAGQYIYGSSGQQGLNDDELHLHLKSANSIVYTRMS